HLVSLNRLLQLSMTGVTQRVGLQPRRTWPGLQPTGSGKKASGEERRPAMSPRLKTPLMLVAGGLLGGAFYFLLIDTTSLPELYVLAGVALACGVAFLLAREQHFVEARVLPWWILRGWRLAWKIPADVAIVCW